MKIYLESLGCDKNLSDAQFMLGKLSKKDYELVSDEYDADVIIVNTCCFIEDAKRESIEAILDLARMKEEGHCKALVVSGCMAQRYAADIESEIPEVDAIVGVSSVEDIVRAIESAVGGERFVSVKDPAGEEDHPDGRILTGAVYSASLKIAEGCDKRCTYCVIPYIRGSYRSIPIETLLAQARDLAAQGARELVLVAQETTLYGTDIYGEKSLHKLLRELEKVEGIKWIRLMYCYPEEIYDELLDAMLGCKKVCHYLDMPVQHASDDILRRMGRRTDGKSLRRIISHIREKIPDISLRTTVMCGFPGETASDHEKLLEFMKEAEFDRLGAFSFSPEEGTPAAKMPGQVPDDIKEKRRDEVMALQQEIMDKVSERYVGTELDVLVEGRIPEEGVYVGRSRRDAPEIDGYVFFPSEREIISGEFARVKIEEAAGCDLRGTLRGII